MTNLESESEVIQSCLTFCDPMDCSPAGCSVMGFSRQEYWSGLPFLYPGDLPNPGIEPGSPALLNIQKTRIMASGPITSRQTDGEAVETVSDFIFGAPKSLQMVIAAMKLKDSYSLEGKL